MVTEEEAELECPYCGCPAGDHPEMSMPLGAFMCSGCQGCLLIAKDVVLLAKNR